ncbi:MAG: hypothetical protein LQ349_001407 [Xanthoria aureola]|nr:MAG: hypothetical protein LQ349_001407 [Xanthoria aureola]
MCCRRSSTDTCRSDGLCDSSWDSNTWRVFCTDPTWQAPNCVKLCLGLDGNDGDGDSGGSVQVTPCQDGSYCCRTGTKANNCCAQGQGVFIDKNGQTTDANPSSTSSLSTATSSSVSTTQTTSSTSLPGAAAASQTSTGPSAATTKSTEKTTNSTGAIAGGVVGGLVAAALIVVAGLWFLKKRKTKETGDKEPWIPYATESQPAYYSEMEGANAGMELPAPRGHEMPTEDSNMKKYKVHELQ